MIIANEEHLVFVNGYDIVIDASLSFDNISAKKQLLKDQYKPLEFLWECNFADDICKTNKSKIFQLKYSDYKKFINDKIDNELEVYLTASILSKIEKKTLKIKVLKNSKESTLAQKINIENLFYLSINHLTGSFISYFLVKVHDENIELNDYKFYWSVEHIGGEALYLNGRVEPSLKINTHDLLIGENKIIVRIEDKKTSNFFYKSIKYMRPKAPYGGNCIASPNFGYSLETEINFDISGWKFDSSPLTYNLKYLDSDNILINLLAESSLADKFSLKFLPASHDFFIEISDGVGLLTLYKIDLNIKPCRDIKIVDGLLDQNILLQYMLINFSLQNSNYVQMGLIKDVYYNSQIDKINLFASNTENIGINLETLISVILSITKGKFNVEKISMVLLCFQKILDNIELIIENIGKLKNVYNILSMIYRKAVQEGDIPDDILIKFNGLLTIMNDKLFDNTLNGEGVEIINESYVSQVSKQSQNNIKNMAISYPNGDNLNKRRMLKNTKIRRLQAKDIPCDELTALCINKNTTEEFFKNNTNSNLGLKANLNLERFLPIKYSQFSNSLDFDITTEKKGEKKSLRNLNEFSENLQTFQIRLKIPQDKNTTDTLIPDSTCVQLNEKEEKEPSTCVSWYDKENFEVICVCNKIKKTVTVTDNFLSLLSKDFQFPPLSLDIGKF